MFLAEQALGEEGGGGKTEHTRNDDPSARIGGGNAGRRANRRAELARQRRQKGAQRRKAENCPARPIDVCLEFVCCDRPAGLPVGNCVQYCHWKIPSWRAPCALAPVITR